jgi:hypothetical protein
MDGGSAPRYQRNRGDIPVLARARGIQEFVALDQVKSCKVWLWKCLFALVA